MPPEEGEPRVFRSAGVSYLRIPAPEPQPTASFYRSVFGWSVDPNRPDPSFADGSGHVIGHFVSDLPVAGEVGIRPYVYVEDIDDVLEKVSSAGGTLVADPYPEGDLWVAVFRDSAGNVIGVWQRAPRS
jgi:uncharacterized protein